MTTNKTETKKITVAEFVDRYERISPKLQNVPNSREYYVKNAKVVDYILFKDKLAVVTRIVKATTQDSEGNFRQSSPIRYILFVTELIKAYTNIQFREGLELYDDYDLLNKNGLIDQLIAAIPEAEYSEFKTLLNMTRDDLIANKYETHVFFNDLVQATVKSFEQVVGKIEPELLAALSSLPNESKSTDNK